MKMGQFTGQVVRRFLGIASGAALEERRALNLPVMVERRRGPRCENCGVGTLHQIPRGRAHAGMMICEAPGCGLITDRVTANAVECVLRAT